MSYLYTWWLTQDGLNKESILIGFQRKEAKIWERIKNQQNQLFILGKLLLLKKKKRQKAKCFCKSHYYCIGISPSFLLKEYELIPLFPVLLWVNQCSNTGPQKNFSKTEICHFFYYKSFHGCLILARQFKFTCTIYEAKIHSTPDLNMNLLSSQTPLLLIPYSNTITIIIIIHLGRPQKVQGFIPTYLWS